MQWATAGTAFHYLPFLLPSLVLVGFHRRLLVGSWCFWHSGLFTSPQRLKMAIGQTRPCMVNIAAAQSFAEDSTCTREEAIFDSHASRVVMLKLICCPGASSACRHELPGTLHLTNEIQAVKKVQANHTCLGLVEACQRVIIHAVTGDWSTSGGQLGPGLVLPPSHRPYCHLTKGLVDLLTSQAEPA